MASKRRAEAKTAVAQTQSKPSNRFDRLSGDVMSVVLLFLLPLDWLRFSNSSHSVQTAVESFLARLRNLNLTGLDETWLGSRTELLRLHKLLLKCCANLQTLEIHQYDIASLIPVAQAQYGFFSGAEFIAALIRRNKNTLHRFKADECFALDDSVFAELATCSQMSAFSGTGGKLQGAPTWDNVERALAALPLLHSIELDGATGSASVLQQLLQRGEWCALVCR